MELRGIKINPKWRMAKIIKRTLKGMQVIDDRATPRRLNKVHDLNQEGRKKWRSTINGVRIAEVKDLYKIQENWILKV